ncbi:MAG TPA: hypothetical protein VGC89_08440, partial [Pyrinomonadaceae bacterium]
MADTLNNNYVRFQGEILLALRAADGTPGAFWMIGNSPSSSLNPTVARTQHKESRSGNSLVDAQISTEKKARIKMTIEDIRKPNIAALL